MGIITSGIVPFAAATLLLLCLCLPAAAGEVDILVAKLVSKGVLTQEDATEIIQEVRTEAARERTAVVSETAAVIARDSRLLTAALPGWIRSTRFSGDFRLRYQFQSRERSPDRHRGRYRLRLGFTTEVTDRVHVGFGLCSGGGDPRSTNQSMTNSFETPDLRLDYAYASYRPVAWLTLVGGKFKNPLWLQPRFLFDTDIRPEGIIALISLPLNPAVELFGTAGFWVLDERSGQEDDPAMAVAQAGGQWRWTAGYLKGAVTQYWFNNVKGTTLDYSSGSNTLDAGGMLQHDFNVSAFSIELGLPAPVPLALYGDYINNWDAATKDEGFLCGMRLGHRKVSKPRQWQLDLSYRRMERDAWLDIFPDADVYGGQTNVHGYAASLQYGLLNRVYLALTYLHTVPLSGANRYSEDLVQADLNFKF